MNKSCKIILTMIAASALAVSSFAVGSLVTINVDPSIKVLVNGEEFKPKDANGNDVMMFTYNGTTYAPLRALAEAYGLEVGYDAEKKMATVSKPTTREILKTEEQTPLDTSYTTSYVDDTTVTLGMQNALESAMSYLKSSSFSYLDLIDQLEYEGYTYTEAVYGVDRCGADWNEQALKTAKSYLNSSSFSYDGLIEQLEYEKFTRDQSVYGVDNCGADWYEQAVKTANSYLKCSSFSRRGLIDQLEYEGFTTDQAEYAVTEVGY